MTYAISDYQSSSRWVSRRQQQVDLRPGMEPSRWVGVHGALALRGKSTIELRRNYWITKVSV